MSPLTRRSVLRTAGAAGAAAVLAGCGSITSGDGAAPRDSPHDGPSGGSPGRRPPQSSEFDSVVDVSQAATGGPLDAVLRENAGDDTLLYLPEGRYRMEDPFEFYEFERLAIVGRGATVVPPEGFRGALLDLGRPGEASGLLLEGIEFDIRGENTGPRPLLALVDDDLTIRDVSVRGRQELSTEMMRVDVTDPEGSGLVERLRLPDGAAPGTGVTGVLVDELNRGHLSFVDCYIEGFDDNGLYAEPPEGSIAVEGGRYANNNVSSVRVRGNSTVRGVHVVCDRAIDGFDNMRGIRLRQGSDTLVENCTVEFRDVSGSDGAITCGHWLESATVRSTRVHIDTDGVSAINLKDPEDDTAADGPIVFEDIEITGEAGQEATVEVSEREGCTFDRVRLRQEGDARDGFFFDEGRGTVRDCVVQVSGEPFVLQDGAIVDRVNVQTTRTTGSGGRDDRRRSGGWLPWL